MSKKPPEDEHPKLIEPAKRPMFGKLQTYFLTGIVVVAPITITGYLTWLFVDWIDGLMRPLIPAKFHPDTYLPMAIPGFGLVVAIILLTLIGALAANFLGKRLLLFGERLVARMPVVRSIYGTVKQIFETVMAQRSTSFKDVVLVEYPRRHLWAIAFVTSQTKGEVSRVLDDDLINVFLPTTPNPTSGFLLFVPKKDIVYLDMSVEEGIKKVISAGIVTPPDPKDLPSPEDAASADQPERK